MAVVYLVIEDKKSHALFWNYINKCIYNSELNIISACGIRNVRNIIKKLVKIRCSDDVILVNVDRPPNSVASNDVKLLLKYISKKKYIALIDEICFEDSILMFKYFREWLYSRSYRLGSYKLSTNKVLLDEYIKYRDNWRLFGTLVNLMKDVRYKSLEKVAFMVLNKLTHEQSKCNFEISKDKFGDCWFCNCKNRYECSLYVNVHDKYVIKSVDEDRKCGLFRNKKNRVDKLNELYRYTIYTKMKRVKNFLYRNGYTVASRKIRI